MGIHAAMFGVLAQVFKKDLVDPHGKPANRRKTYERIFAFFNSALFTEASEIIYNGCATSMVEILEHTFPELLESNPMIAAANSGGSDVAKVFLDPLFDILKTPGTSKNANAAACYCLRSLMEYLRNNAQHLVTQTLAQRFSAIAIKYKVFQENFVEILRDLMRFFDKGITGIVTTKTQQLYEYSIKAMSVIMGGHSTQGALHGNQLKDITAILKLQRQMVEGSDDAAKFIVPSHYKDAMKALELVKDVKNSKLQIHVEALKTAWETLRMKAQGDERDDQLQAIKMRIGLGAANQFGAQQVADQIKSNQEAIR